MHYQKYASSPELQPFIECFFVWEGETTAPLEVQSPPNGFAAMVFNFSDPYRAYQDINDVKIVPKAFVSGQFTSNYHLVMNGKIKIVGMVCKPSALYNFFKIRMSELVNTRMPLENILGLKAKILYDAINAEPYTQNKIHLLDSYFKSCLAEAKSRLSIIDDAVEYIDHCKGNVTVEAVAKHLKISCRYLGKKYLEKVGVSPKLYIRIKRFAHLSYKVAYQKKIDWQDIVLESGLHDQSHLAKEYNEFNRMNPTDYHYRHSELIRFMKE